MKRLMRHMAQRCLMLVLLCVGVCTARAADGPVMRATVHPYLLFTPQKIARLKERIQTQPVFAQAWAEVLTNANRLAEQRKPNGSALETLGLAYCMTGDQRFAEKSREILLRECQKSGWTDPQMLRRDPPWHSALDTARNCYDVAVGFDSIYNYLSAADRKTIADGLVKLGIRPTLDDWLFGGTRIHALDTMGHNWWSACVFMAGFGAMAVLDEEPQAKNWLEQINEGSVEWFNYAGSDLETKPRTFDPDGGLYESVNYDAFAMSEYLLFRLAWENAFRSPPPPAIPVLDKVGDYFINVCYPNSGALMSLNFGDGSLAANGSRPVVLLWALGQHEPRYLWYLKQTESESFREGTSRSTPLGLVYYPDENDFAATPTVPDLPPSAIFKTMGWAMLRSSWQSNATLLAVKSGFAWNHSHADAGSFILLHDGNNLLIDSGNCSYGRPEYDDYYRQSRAHNVVLFNGQAENSEDTYFGSQFPGSVSHLLDAGGLKYVMADATGPTSHLFVRNFRHFLWIGNVILVIDDVKSFEPGQFSWLLHVDGNAERKGLDLRVTQGDAGVRVRPLFPEPFPDAGLPSDFPEDMRLAPMTGLADHEPDTKVTYYAFEPPELTRQTSFITAILLDNGTNHDSPQLERLNGDHYIGVRVRQNGTTTDVYLNLLAQGRIRHRNACISADGWDTDAYLTAITYPDGCDLTNPDAARRFLIADGSYLRRNGKVVLDSLSKVFLAATKQDGKLDVLLQGQPVIHARLRVGSEPAVVSLNRKKVKPSYDPATRTILLSVSHSGSERDDTQ
jgi:hypothetical protein